MSTPLGYVFTFPTFLTGNQQIDSLIYGSQWLSPTWKGNVSTTNLTYSFITPGRSFFATNYSAEQEYRNSFALTFAQQDAVKTALGAWSAVANLKFTQVTDNAVSAGDLRFGGYAGMDDKTAAWGYYPDRSPVGGDVWIGPTTNNPEPVNGTYDFMTFVHEIGHALGLKHPFEASQSNSTVLNPVLDDSHFTIMSYNNAYSYQPTTPMLLDILVIQKMYGANMLWQTGDNVYRWAPDQSVFQTIWDAGGNDTIDASNQLAAVNLDLNEGAFSQIGKAFIDGVNQTLVNDGLAIAYGAKIENATGSAFDDVLTGNALNNVLNGMGGADTLIGGAGNDTYVVDNIGDTVIETGTSLTEIDTVLASSNYTLGANVENLTLTGSDHLNGTGNALNNILLGNSGNNVLDGGLGADRMVGGTGNDTYVVDNLKDVVSETGTLAGEIDTVVASISYTLGANLENLTLTGSDNLNGTGNALNNVLIGNDGNNRLNGGLGIDTLIGGGGNDTYYLDQAAELALVQEDVDNGTDQLYVAYAAKASTSVIDLSQNNLLNVENVTVTGIGAFSVIGNDRNNTLVGNASINVLQGGAGDDWLDGGLGADSLSGGMDDDVYIVDNVGDKVIELANEGHDLVKASVSYSLSANVEDALLLGAAAVNLTGNELANTLTGNAAANILNGGAGADILIGGAGNDTYVVDNIGDTVIETGTSLTEIDTVRASINYTLDANVENLTLTGSDHLNGTGNALNNILLGNSGNNVLDGGLGADRMVGGTGNDTYVVDNLKDVVSETGTLAGEIDTVVASISYTLGANLENLTLTGSDNLNGTGNALNNVLIGNDGNNRLNGGLGIDTLIGGGGNDTYYLDQAAELALVQEDVDNGTDQLYVAYAAKASTSVIDLSQNNLLNVENVTVTGIGAFSVIGNDRNNTLVGNASINVLQGGAGDDWLDGGLGADSLSGGMDDDVYIVDNVGDKVIELANEGHDLVKASVSYSLSANVEDALLLGAAAVNLTGNELANTLTGNAAANILNGGAGADILIGGAGNDTYVVDNIGDTVIETGTSLTEIDTVRASINYTLDANVENLTLTGSDHLNGTGNALNNILLGNSGNNVLDGGLGADRMVGGTGNDTYVVDNLKDVVSETGTLAGEIDTVVASISYTLGANLENLTLTGSDNLNGTGNALNNVLIGNDGNNLLNGGLGNDVLDGGVGNDTLIGGLGIDALTGGAGADRFVFNALNEMGKGSLSDVITDFSSLDGDKLDFSKFDANLLSAGVNKFTFINSNDFTGAGQLRFVDHVLYGNVNGDLAADFKIQLVGLNSFSTHDLVA
ncbi:matrixin family metalloprotease [Pseudomonas sp. NFX71]|uniref:matrixin family metalloprotease n=1 Tax=Pseudomonas sp. NFX71 TaxID=3399121 RepID=UPI003A85DFA1